MKCDGEHPICGRCSGLGEECHYSARLPMGRPKKRKLQSDDEVENGVVKGTPQTIGSDRQSDSGQENEANGSVATLISLQDAVFNDQDLAAWS